ncbi:Lsr2 family protein [Rhodococcus sovatensis]|uniref:Lsr2 family protein n=1 Tax=Rhodococcus sovatensis TaxID=1805840 RepID=A0ABZ2PHG0_9NOCA
MATRTLIQLTDDIDDKEIPDGTGENITFSVNGAEYEIDLNDKNAKEFHRKLDYYIGYGTRTGGRKVRKASKGAGANAVAPKRDAAQTRVIREWAQANGYDVSPRGRLPLSVEEAFDAAH